MEVLPIMSTLENLIENPDEWEDPNDQERKTRKYKAKITVRFFFLINNCEGINFIDKIYRF